MAQETVLVALHGLGGTATTAEVAAECLRQWPDRWRNEGRSSGAGFYLGRVVRWGLATREPARSASTRRSTFRWTLTGLGRQEAARLSGKEGL